MPEDARLSAIRSLLFEYVKSPSLRHIRDPHFVIKLATDILKAVDRGATPWQKWTSHREQQVAGAATTWIPVEDLCAYLNSLDGPTLTITDIAQRLRAIQEDGFGLYPDEDLKESCLALYARERAIGTEMPAIIGALQELVEIERGRLHEEHVARYKQNRQAEREALRQRLLSGVDCKWTSLTNSSGVFCRMNGRLYRLTQGQDKRWTLCRLESVDDVKAPILGHYQTRGEANKVVAKIAYQPEPRW